MNASKKCVILGVGVDCLSAKEYLNRLQAHINAKEQVKIVTPNPQILLEANRNDALKEILNRSQLVLPDGIGIVLAARMLGDHNMHRIGGIDFASLLLSKASKQGLRVYLFGGKPGVATEAAKNLQQQYSGLCVCGTHHGYVHNLGEQKALLRHIRSANPHMLFVCLGSPKQEIWLARYARLLPDVKILMGLGGSLDVWAERVPRAPKAMQKAGFEWLYRCARQPKRLRFLWQIPHFLALIALEKMDRLI